jgi:hypothetical protein
MDDHREWISTFLTQLVGDELLQHAGKERLLQVVGVEAEPAQRHPLLRELRQREKGTRPEAKPVGAFQ